MIVRYEVVDKRGNRIALCNSRQLAESYQRTEPGSEIVIKKGVDTPPDRSYTVDNKEG
jgi:hypothetical protein